MELESRITKVNKKTDLLEMDNNAMEFRNQILVKEIEKISDELSKFNESRLSTST